MAEPTPPPARSGSAVRAVAGLLLACGLAAGLGAAFGARAPWASAQRAPGVPGDAPASGATAAAPTTLGGVPLFSTWPEKAPDLALVLTGQTYGYLSPCGCSRPQRGGLERRANFFASLHKKGWTTLGLDLGDVAVAPTKGVPRQNQLKYRYTMRSLAEMGYAAVGLGDHDFAQNLLQLLSEYTFQNPNKPPVVLAANLLGVTRDNAGAVTQVFPREQYFPGGEAKARPSVEAFEVLVAAGKPAVAIVGIIGKDVAQEVEKQDKSYGFAANETVVRDALAAIAKHPAKPALKVLLYSGSHELAQEAAKAFPQFQLVVCQTPQSEPPQFPTVVNAGKTIIVQVGQKGKNVGVVGVFNGASGQPELKYQLVPLGEEYITPDDKESMKANKVLGLLEEYAAEVKKQNLLEAARAKQIPHAAQIRFPNDKPTYVGVEVCAKCHANEVAVWKGSRHSHAYESLEKAEYRPGLRQYDPECVVCHVTGFEYQGGFENERKTAHLKGNQCENCHGPGSAHAAAPANVALYAGLAPWKNGDPTQKLPSLAEIKKLAAANKVDRGAMGALTPNQQQMINAVSSLCMKCHDEENDPKFDFFEYFPRVHHSGLK